MAERFGCPIISCDSRQIYRDIPIGTAAPTAEEQARVKHYFVATHALEDNYNAGQYERDALALLDELFATHDVVVMTGGSMLYADAVCKGLDDLPAVPEEIRKEIATKSLEELQHEVQRLDPDYWQEVDQQNPARLAHCIEICIFDAAHPNDQRASVQDHQDRTDTSACSFIRAHRRAREADDCQRDGGRSEKSVSPTGVEQSADGRVQRTICLFRRRL